MSDTLLQRLRQYEGTQSQTTACYNGLRDEAADEIDRLRDGNDRLRDALAYIVDLYDRLSGLEDAQRIAEAALAKETGK